MQVCDVGWLLCAQIGMRPEIEAIGGALQLEKGIYLYRVCVAEKTETNLSLCLYLDV